MQFHETKYGQRFFDHQLPTLTNALERIADGIEASNKQPEIDYKAAWEKLKEAITGEGFSNTRQIPGYINIENTICFMNVLEKQFKSGGD